MGGAILTTLSLYLAASGIVGTQQISPYTFAAPTAGDRNFAAWFNQQFPTAQCYYNQYDVAPNAWWNLVGSGPASPPTPEAVEHFYPRMKGGLKLKKEIEGIVSKIAGDVGRNV